MAIRVLLADDHAMVRTGLVEMLAGSEAEVIGTASTGKQAVQLTEKLKPDVVLLDLRLPEMDGLEVLERIRQRHPQVRVVILTAYDNPTYMARAAALGANDFLLKSASRDELLAVLRAAVAGQGPVGEGPFREMVEVLSGRPEWDEKEIPLTQREVQVLRHLALGLSNKEIGRSLGISVETVKEHVQNIFRKLQVSERTQAAVWALRKGLV
jgi:DNA-binding NarL/FixJ family response regulator